MAEASTVVYSRAALADRLANWPGAGADTTWALVTVGAMPSGGELAAAREAAKLCDRVVALRLEPGKPVAPGYAETLRSAGVDIVWVPKELTGPVRVDVGVTDKLVGTDGPTLALQAVTTVLPNLVVVPRGNVAVVRVFRNILAGLGELFTLRFVE
jgi:hypothetical protein